MYRFPDLFFTDLKVVLHYAFQTLRQHLLIGECDKRRDQVDVLLRNDLHIVADIFRIGNDHRAVIMVLRIRIFFSFIINTGIEDPIHALLHEPGDMTVYHLRRIAFRFTRDGIHTQTIQLLIRERRKHDTESQMLKELRPERIVLIHIQNTRNTDYAPRCLCCLQRLVVKHSLTLEFKQIRRIILLSAAAHDTFAAVTGNISVTVGELTDRQAATVLASLTSGLRSSKGQLRDLFKGKHGRYAAGPALFCDQRSTHGSHQSCLRRTDHFTSGYQLKAA